MVQISVQFSSSVVSNSSRPHELQHARPPCPSPTAGVYPNPSESVMPSNHFIFCRPLLLPLSIFLASGSFSMCQFIVSGGQSIGISASRSVLSINIQDLFPLGLIGLISLQSKGLSKDFSSTTV